MKKSYLDALFLKKLLWLDNSKSLQSLKTGAGFKKKIFEKNVVFVKALMIIDIIDGLPFTYLNEKTIRNYAKRFMMIVVLSE